MNDILNSLNDYVVNRDNMYKYTKDPFLYYKYKNKYYRIPTFNKIIKIIDWGRCTFEWNNQKIRSVVFDSDNEAYGQYIFDKLSMIQKKTINENNSMDLSLLANDLLRRDEGENIPDGDNNLTQFLEECLIDKDGNVIDIEEDSFLTYKVLAKETYSGVPKNQITKKYFKQFEVKYNIIPKNSKIYNLDWI